MLGVLLLKELRHHVLGIRFGVGFALVCILFVLGALVWRVRYSAELEHYRQGLRDAEVHLQNAEANGMQSLPYYGLKVWNPPSALTFIADAQGTGLPQVAAVTVTRGVTAFERPATRNPLLQRLDPDWQFIVGTVVTLLALVLTYDAVAGEMERGTLRQVLANSVPRDLLLLSKFLAVLLLLAVTLIFGMVAATVVVGLGGHGGGPSMVTLAGSLLACLLCVSVFIWLGLWVSSITHHSALALLGGMMIWSLLAVFIPSSGGLVGQQLAPVPLASEAQEQAWTAAAGASEEEKRDAAIRARDRYQDQLLRQVSVARTVMAVSPPQALRVALEALSVTGLARYRLFRNQVETYQRELQAFADEHKKRAAQKEPVPRFRLRPPAPVEAWSDALPHMLVLLAANLFAAGGAYLAFRRCDVT